MTISKHIKNTFKHAFIYSLSGMLGKAVGFIMLPVYAHCLKAEGYGIIGMLDVCLSVLTLLIGYGISSSMKRFYFTKATKLDKNSFVSTTIILMFLLVITICLPALLLNRQIAHIALGNDKLSKYIILAIITFIANITSKNAETYILIKQKSILFSVLSLSKLTLALTLNIFLIVHLEMGVLGYLYSSLIVAIFFSAFMHLYALVNVGIHFKKEDAISILKFSMPLIPGYISMFIRGNADRVILRTFMGLSQLGIFEMLFKFATLIGILIVEPFMRIWDVKRYELCDKTEGPILLSRIFTYQMALMLFFGLILSFEIPLILKLLTPPEFWIGGYVAFLCVMSRIIWASGYHFIFGLLYQKKTYKISIIQGVAALISVTFNYFLIKNYGILGAVLSNCLVYTFQCALSYYMSKNYYKIPFEWGKLFFMFFAVIALFISINQFIPSDSLLIFSMSKPVHDFLINFASSFQDISIVLDKILMYSVQNTPIFVEAFLKLFSSLIFIIFLLIIGIVPRQLRIKTLLS